MYNQMKVGVIIIGFKYEDREIQSTLYDIYRIYDYFDKLSYNCYILTDLEDFRFDRAINNTILKNHVDQKLINFIDKMGRDPPWYKYTHDFHTLKNNISELPQFDLCITYYSGHGRTRGIELPSGSTLNYVGFKTLLKEKAKKELVMLMDCCHVSDTGLSYYYDSVYVDNKFVGTFKPIDGNRCKDFEYINPSTLIIASSGSDEKASSNKYASLFTKYLLDFLMLNENRSFRSLIEYVRIHIAGHETNNQSVKIYSSVPTFPIVPSYFFDKYYIDMNSTLDYINVTRL